MKNLDDQHLDEFFRSDLEPEYDKFDEANWAEMEEKLNGIAPKATKLSLANIAQYVAIVIMLSISAIAVWQTHEGRKAIDTLSTEVEELKKAQVTETVTAQEILPIVEEEPIMVEMTETKPAETATKPVVQPIVESKAQIAEVEEQKDNSQLSVAETKTDKEAAKPAEEKATTAKYYMLVDGEFVPVAEFDHPGAEQGDSASGNGNISQQASN